VFSNAELVDENGNSLGKDLWSSIEFDKNEQARYAGGEQLKVMLRRLILVYGMTMAFRGIFKPKLLPFGCRFVRPTVHDSWISLLLSSIGAYGVAVPTPLVKYRQHGKQLARAGKAPGFVYLVLNKRSNEAKPNLEFANVLEHIAIRLQQLEPASESVLSAREQLIQKAIHLRARAHANSSHGVQRIRTVFYEALSGRYGRYSRSFKSIMKDLMTG
jgi:hypothetical protein